MLELKSPISIVWELTNRCNFKCPHCRAYKINSLDNEDIENRILEEIISNNILTVNISGGEPLLNERLMDIIQELSQNGIYVGISTNGWLYKEKRQKLIDAGLKFIQISLDGPKEIHDKFRGVEGAFECALEALQLAKKDGLFTQMNVTITSHNMNTLNWNYYKALELNVDKILYRRVVPAGKAIENKYVIPSKNDYYTSLKQLMELKNDTNMILAIDDPIIGALKNIENEEYLGCEAGIKSLGISACGDVYPCIFLREKIGNLMQNDLKIIWNESQILKKLRNKDINECKDCKYQYSCGGCRAFSGVFNRDQMCPLSDK